MKKKLLMLLLVVTSLTALFAVSLTTANAVIPTYGISVGGVVVNKYNASDVLGDGTVSYDAEENVLTLNNASISDYVTFEMYGDDTYAGIYVEAIGLKINLIGTNRISIPVDSDTANCIVSENNLEICGSGKLVLNCFSGVLSVGVLTVKDCTVEATAIACSSLSGIEFENATLSANYNIAATYNGDITLKNTTVLNGGAGAAFSLETGNLIVENSTVTSNGKATFDATVGDITIKNSVLDLTSSEFAIACGGDILLDGVTGAISARGEGYGIYAQGDVTVKNSTLEIDSKISEGGDFAVGIASSENDVMIDNSNLIIEVRAEASPAMGIGSPFQYGKVTITDSIINISARGMTAVGLSDSKVELNNCITAISVSAPDANDSLAAGIVSENSTVINGGLVEITSSGTAKSDHCIFAIDNIATIIIKDADVKLSGEKASSHPVDLSFFDKSYEITASVNGIDNVDYNEDEIDTYKLFHIHPFYNITLDANGGTGEMTSETDFYGTYTLPENQFTAPEGMIFAGWSTSPDGEIIPITSFTPHADVTLYAIWEEDPSYAPEDSEEISEEESEEEVESEEESTPSNPEHSHDFGGEWKSDGDNHWKECSCGEKTLKSTHSDTNANEGCDICGAILKSANGLSGGAIAGIAVGSVAVVGFGGFAIFWFVIKKKSFADLIATFKRK